MSGKEKKVLRFQDDDSFITPNYEHSIPFDDITLRSSIGSPVAASSVARPNLHRANVPSQELERSHALLFRQVGGGMPGHEGDDPLDSARSRTSLAPSEMTDTSLGILNLDELATGLEELDDEFSDLSDDNPTPDPQSPRSGIVDGEEMVPDPSLPSPSPRVGGGMSLMALSQMSAPSIRFLDSQDEDEETGSDLSDEDSQPVPGQRSQTQGIEDPGSSEIDTEDEINAVMQDQSRVQPVGETDIWRQGSMNFSRGMTPPHQSSHFSQSPPRDFNDENPFDGGGAAAASANNDFGDNNFAYDQPFPGDGAMNPFDDGPLPDQNGLPAADFGFGSEEDFLASDDALVMMDKDQQDFEKDNIFRQDEHIEDDAADDGQSAWTLPDGSHMTLRMSMIRSKEDAWEDEASYRESLGAVMAMRSEALGSLSGDAETGKPHFGDGTIISPPPQRAVALVDKTVSRNQDNGDEGLSGFHDDGDDGLFAASEREAGVGENVHEMSPPTSQKGSMQGNRSGVYVPSMPSKFLGKKGSNSNISGTKIQKGALNESVSSEMGTPEGYKTPPMDLSLITAAIAQASSSANPQDLAKMILTMSQQVKTIKDKKEVKTDEAKTDAQWNDHRGSREQRLDLSGDSRTHSGNTNSSSSNERLSLEGSGGSGEDRRSSGSSSSSQGSSARPRKEWRKYSDSSSRPSRDRMPKQEHGGTREEYLGREYLTAVQADRFSTSQFKMSDTINFLEGDDQKGDLSRMNGHQIEHVSNQDGDNLSAEHQVSKPAIRKAEHGEMQARIALEGRHSESEDGTTDEDVSAEPMYKDRWNDSDAYRKGEGISQTLKQDIASRNLDGNSFDDGRGSKSSQQISRSVPLLSRQAALNDRTEEPLSQHDKIQQDLSYRSNLPRRDPRISGLESDPVAHQKVKGQISNLQEMGELRSQAIPDGKPTERESVAAVNRQTYPLNRATNVRISPPRRQQSPDSVSTSQKDSLTRLSPRQRKSTEDMLSMKRNVDGVSAGPNNAVKAVSPRQKRSLDGASVRTMSSQGYPRVRGDDDRRQRDDVPIRQGITREALERLGQEDSMNVGYDIDISRLSIDSQADIIIGKHRIPQTPRDKRAKSNVSDPRISTRPLDYAGIHRHRGVPHSNQFQRFSSAEDGTDLGIEADVDSGFSSEHPQRYSNTRTDSQENISSSRSCRGSSKDSKQNVDKRIHAMPQLIQTDKEDAHNFTLMNRDSLSPTPSPRQSIGQSPIASLRHSRRSVDSDPDRTFVPDTPDRTLVAESPEFASPRSNSSSGSRSRSRSRNESVSSGSGSLCSTPKRKSKTNTQVSGQEPVSHASHQTSGSAHLLPPQSYLPTDVRMVDPALPPTSDPLARPMLPTQLAPSSFYTNQALSDRNFLSLYLNDRPISRLLPTSSSSLVDTQPHLALPLQQASHPHGLYLGQGTNPNVGLYTAPQSLPVTVNTNPGYSQLDVQRAHMTSHVTGHMTGLVDGGLLPRPPFSVSGVQSHSAVPQPTIVSGLIVPSEQRFRDVACIGIAAQDFICLQNPSSRWLQCTLEVVSLCVNGEELQVDQTSQVFLMRPRLIIGPHTSEDHKIIFAPRKPGIYEAKIQVGSSPVVADSEMGLLRVTAPHMMSVRAVAELPELEVEGAVKGRVDLGEMVYGSERSKVICLVNKGLSSLPVRIFFINSVSELWYAASLTTEDSMDHSTTASPRRPLHLTLPGRSRTSIEGSIAPPQPNLTIKLRTQPRASRSESAPLGAPDKISVSFKIELDVPDRIVSLADVSVDARVGVAKLHLPGALANEVFLFSCAPGDKTSRNLLLKNAGNIRLELRLMLPKGAGFFQLTPESVALDPDQQRDILVRFSPPKDTPSVVDIPLFIQVRPDGPNYELALRGEVVTQKARRSKVMSPAVLCNRQFLAWGGVALGKTGKRSAILRNPGKEILSLKLAIRDSEDFKLQYASGRHAKLSTSRQVVLKPLEDYPMDVVFTPAHLSTYKAVLDIKPLNADTKFTLPLTGYGGVSNLIIEDINLKGDTYLHDLGPLTPGQHTVLTIKVLNTGLRAAFVKAVCFQDSRAKVKIPSSHLNIEPSDFVISPKMKKTLTLILYPRETDFLSSSEHSQEVAAVGLYYGDEVLRQLFRRASQSGGCKPPEMSAENPLRGVALDTKFLGDEHVQEEFNMDPEPNVSSLLYSSISRLLLSLTGSRRRQRSPPQAHRISDPPDLPKRETPHGVVLGEETLTFDTALVGQSRMKKLFFKNVSREYQTIKFLKPEPPFYIGHKSHTIQPKHYVRVPVTYKPRAPGKHTAFMAIQTDTNHSLVAQLIGECI